MIDPSEEMSDDELEAAKAAELVAQEQAEQEAANQRRAAFRAHFAEKRRILDAYRTASAAAREKRAAELAEIEARRQAAKAQTPPEGHTPEGRAKLAAAEAAEREARGELAPANPPPTE
jgi:hypothetical protein